MGMILGLAFIPHPFKIEHFPKAINTSEYSEEQRELGRLLFYDPILSDDNTISCASCHSSYNGFAHADHALSHGIHNSMLTRNAPALFNLAWQKTFMWDGAINNLLAQPLAPISNSKEMGSNMQQVIEKLNRSAFYRAKFMRAFSLSDISSNQVLRALEAFQLSIISNHSKYDSVMQRQVRFTDQEERGYALYKKNCASCHAEPMFTTGEYFNNGLPVNEQSNDYGRCNLTHNPEDSMKFKVPSLRNLKYTFPYMHDGRFNSLNEVMNHYTKGIKKSTTLAPQLTAGIVLKPNEKIDLIAFLLTLNDSYFVRNNAYSYPNELQNQQK